MILKRKFFANKKMTTKERLKWSIIPGVLCAIPGFIVGAGIGGLVGKSIKSALLGGTIGGSLTGGPIAYMLWNENSEKVRKEKAQKDREYKKKMEECKIKYKTWKDIETKLGVRVPQEFIKFVELYKSKDFLCKYIPYIEEPYILGKCIEDILAKPDSKFSTDSRWEDLTLIGNGVGDDESDNFYYDFDDNTWNDYWNVKKRSLKEIILPSYQDKYWLEDLEGQGIEADDEWIQESIEKVKKNK